MALFLWNHAFYDKRCEKKSRTFVICVSFYTNNKGITHVSIYCIIYCISLNVFLLISITMNEVFNNWLAHYLLRSPISILLIKVCMRRWPIGWPRPSAKYAGSVRAILQDPPTATLARIICWRGVARWSKEMVDLSIIDHFIPCDAYSKNNLEWHAINGNMRDSLVIRVEADTNHKSARYFFTPFVIKCMILQKQCHQLADIYLSFFA